MHDGELGAGHCLKGRLVAGLGVEYVPVVDMGLALVSVIVSERVVSTGEVGVVAKARNTNPVGASPVQIADLGYFNNKAVCTNYEALYLHSVVARAGMIGDLERQGILACADEGMRIEVFLMKKKVIG